jgi:RNA polymerase-interacting CarD/CdnL/TRCF family regulator
MTEQPARFKKGDWIVHYHYGVGRVRGIETKRMDGQKKKYFRVEAEDCVYWVGVENVDVGSVRPVTPSAELPRRLKVLEKPAREMAADYRTRQARIKEAKAEGSLESICRIVRDLTARQQEASLNENETRELRSLRSLLLREWATSADISLEKARMELRQVLYEGNA